MGTSRNADHDLGMKALQAGRYAEAYGLLQSFAEAGDTEAQAHLASLILFGQHRFADTTVYNEWFMSASEEEHAAFVRDQKADIAQAMRWLQNASDHGIGPASHNLAQAYLSGYGDVASDMRRGKVKELLAKAREQGFAFFGGEEGSEEYLQALEGYAASQGIGMPWENRP